MSLNRFSPGSCCSRQSEDDCLIYQYSFEDRNSGHSYIYLMRLNPENGEIIWHNLADSTTLYNLGFQYWSRRYAHAIGLGINNKRQILNGTGLYFYLDGTYRSMIGNVKTTQVYPDRYYYFDSEPHSRIFTSIDFDINSRPYFTIFNDIEHAYRMDRNGENQEMFFRPTLIETQFSGGLTIGDDTESVALQDGIHNKIALANPNVPTAGLFCNRLRYYSRITKDVFGFPTSYVTTRDYGFCYSNYNTPTNIQGICEITNVIHGGVPVSYPPGAPPQLWGPPAGEITVTNPGDYLIANISFIRKINGGNVGDVITLWHPVSILSQVQSGISFIPYSSIYYPNANIAGGWEITNTLIGPVPISPILRNQHNISFKKNPNGLWSIVNGPYGPTHEIGKLTQSRIGNSADVQYPNSIRDIRQLKSDNQGGVWTIHQGYASEPSDPEFFRINTAIRKFSSGMGSWIDELNVALIEHGGWWSSEDYQEWQTNFVPLAQFPDIFWFDLNRFNEFYYAARMLESKNWIVSLRSDRTVRWRRPTLDPVGYPSYIAGDRPTAIHQESGDLFVIESTPTIPFSSNPNRYNWIRRLKRETGETLWERQVFGIPLSMRYKKFETQYEERKNLTEVIRPTEMVTHELITP